MYNILEQQINKCDFINECFIFNYGDTLSCMCSLSDEGKNFLILNGVICLKQTIKNFIEPDIILSNIAFIDKLPLTDNGEINKDLINHFFNVNLSFPIILSRYAFAQKIEYELFFDKSFNFFDGNFPDFKIVPASVQIYIAKEFANIHFDLHLGQGQWKNIKFINIITPDKIVKLSIEKLEKQIEYKFFDNEKIYSSGSFDIKNVFEGI